MSHQSGNSIIDEIINFQRNSADDDYYSILGCDESSTEEQINAEYKARVLSCHPDKHPDDQNAHEKFALLSVAKDTLLNSEKRRDYDKWRRSQIAIPFETWRSMAHVKTSMHWGVKKEQTALDHPDSTGLSTQRTPVATEPTEEDKRISELRDRMKFTPREAPVSSGWRRETSNPLLQKFRNYEI